jgi:arsenate reductase (glutaredoxin)
MKVTLYHKPTCGTCQKVLKALKENDAEITAIEYLKTPPSVAELEGLAKKLGEGWESMIRKKEPLYKEKYEGKTLGRSDWMKILHENPDLIERPMVVMGNTVVIARPPEKLELLFK